MISAGVEGRLPYMTYPEPWRGPPKQPELFLRPAPKPLPPTASRYNGVGVSSSSSTATNPPAPYPNGTRLAPPPRPVSKYPSPPVNLVAQTKEEVTEDISQQQTQQHYPYRVFPQFTHFSYPLANQLCQQPYLMRAAFPPTPLSPMEPFSPTTPTSTFLSPPSTFSPPSALKQSPQLIREKRTPPQTPPHTQTSGSVAAFKVPSGKEGSLKHRILIRPEDNVRSAPLDLQKPPEGRKRLQGAAAALSPPRSPKRTLNNNVVASGTFAKGSLIQLHNGDLRRIEDMRTEDFVMSAERSPELRLAESTVVKIEEGQNGNTTITLTYNQRRAQVDVESTVEHPYFVMGHGWASCNPERTQQCFGLKVHRLQVGDVLISVTPREPPQQSPASRGAAATTVMTTATTTSMTARQLPVSLTKTQVSEPTISSQSQPMNLHFTPTHGPQSMSPESMAARKRRWSAPDQICDEEEQNHVRRHRAD